MAASIHNSLARFRVNDVLLASAVEKAARDGLTLSELIRTAIRREVHVK